MINLLPDQIESINKVQYSMLQGKRSILLQGATGSGKSYIGSEIIHRSLNKGKTSWFMVPRRDLIRQMREVFNDFEIPHGIIAAGVEYNPFGQVYICSTDTVKNRLHHLKAPNLCFIDETHHGGEGLDKVIQWLKSNGTWIIGLSATPWKLSGKGLGCWYEELICGPSIRWLIDNNRLSEYRAFAPSTPDLSMIDINNGDYAKGQLAEKMEEDRVLIGNSVNHYKKYSMGKLGITFAVSRRHSELLAQAYRDSGVPAVHMDGDTPEDVRIRMAKAFARREILQLCNAELLTFGYDLASASGYKDVCIQTMTDCQPTKSLAKQRQKNGRVLRYDNEPHLIFDHANNIKEHGMPCEDIEWTLEDRKKRQSNGERNLPVRQCTQCYFCHHPSKSCPNCGHVYPIEVRAIKEVEGELEELRITAAKKIARQEQGKASTMEQLIEIGKRRGYKNPAFWAKNVMKGRKK